MENITAETWLELQTYEISNLSLIPSTYKQKWFFPYVPFTVFKNIVKRRVTKKVLMKKIQISY